MTMQERTIAIDSDGSSITLRYDDRGFLVGDALDLGKTQKELESISGDVLAIRAFLMGSASRNRTESTDTVSPSINSARTSEKAAKKLLEAAKKLSRAADEVGNGSTRQSSERIASENRAHERARRESTRRQSQEREPPPIQSDGNERIPPTRAASERRATEATGDLARAASETNERERRARRARPSEANGNNGAGGRDANGRFLPGGRGANSIADSIKDGVGNGLKGVSTEIVNADISRVDPAIEATKEALAPVAMLGRASLAVGRIGLKGAVGTAKLLGRGFSSRGTDNWLKRLWNESRLSRRDSNLWNERRLREMRNRRGEGDGRGGLLGLIAMLLPLFAGFIAMLSGLFSKFFSMTGLAGLLGKILPGALARRLLGGLGSGRDRGGNGGGSDGRRNRRDRSGDSGDSDERRRTDTQRRWDERRARRNGGEPPVPPNPPDGDNGRQGGRRGGRMRGMRGLGWLAAGAALFGAATVEADDSLTRDEKNQEHGASAGAVVNGVGGAMAGAAIGTMIFPGVGTVIGGLIGGFAADYFTGDAAADLGAKFTAWVSNTPLSAMPGQIVDKFAGWTDDLKSSAVGQAVIAKVGEWTQELKNSKIGEYITGAWDALTKGIRSTWDSFSDTLTKTWGDLQKGAKNALDGVNGWFKEKTGVDVGATATAAYEATKTAATNAYEATKEAATSAYEYTKDAASEAVTGRKSSVSERWNGGARDDIVAAAKATGMDAGVLANIANYESMGFKHDARPVSKSKPHLNTVRQFDGTMAMSSAYGYGQFTDGTWMDTLNKHGSKHGVAGAGSLTKDQANAFRKDRKLQAIMLAEFSKDNIATAKKYGGTDDLANAYALHNLGGGDEGGGAKFLKAMAANPNAKVSSVLSGTVIERNTGLYGKSGEKTLAEAYKGMSVYMHEGDSYAQEARNVQNGITSPAAAATGAISTAVNAANLGKAAYDKISGMVGKSTASSEKLTPDQIKELSGIINYTGNTPLSEGIGGLAGQSQQDFFAMAKEYQSKTGNKLNVGSAFRSAKEQERIASEARAKGIRAAEPGKSEHQHGYALDIDKQGTSSPQVAQLEKMGLLQKYNFSPDASQRAGSRNKAGEAWHIEHDTSTYDDADATTKAQIVAMSKGGMDGYAIDKLVRSGAVGAIAKSAAPTVTANSGGEARLKGSADPKNLPPKAGYEVKNTGGYYDYYEYVPTTTTSTVKTPSVPAMPPPPPPPKIAAPPEPPKQSPVASQHATTLTGALGEVGRDVSDRTIAHIVTGGIGQRI